MTPHAPKPTPPPDVAEQIQRIEAVLKAMAITNRRRPLKVGWRLLKRQAS